MCICMHVGVSHMCVCVCMRERACLTKDNLSMYPDLNDRLLRTFTIRTQGPWESFTNVSHFCIV